MLNTMSLRQDSAELPSVRYRYTGHQSFSLRIAWLPKAIREICRGSDPLSDVDLGIVTLGLGKNMVESLRCWIEAFQVATRSSEGWSLSPLAQLIFHPDSGLDPYLEDHSSNWLLHWLICTNDNAPLFAWECLFNRWSSPELSASEVLKAFELEVEATGKEVSRATLKQHWEVFLNSYRPPRNVKGEDHLDSALSVLGLIKEAGERRTVDGHWEPLYTFDTGYKTGIPQQLFAFFVHDWWNRKFPDEKTVPIRELVSGDQSPGRLLKMQEKEILLRIEALTKLQPKLFQLTESVNIRQLHRSNKVDGRNSLISAYTKPVFL